MAVELWSRSKPYNINIPQTVQSVILRSIMDAPWYISNHIHRIHVKISYINDIIRSHAITNRNHNVGDSNRLINELLNQSLEGRRLKMQWPEDLTLVIINRRLQYRSLSLSLCLLSRLQYCSK